MPLRRTVFAFAATFVCALVVFTLPRFVFNSARAALPQARQDTTSVTSPAAGALLPTQTAAATAAPRSLGSRLTGLVGLAVLLGIGVALSRNRRAINWRTVAWGIGLQAG